MPWSDLEARAYWVVFIGVFILVAAWESRRPVRTLVRARGATLEPPRRAPDRRLVPDRGRLSRLSRRRGRRRQRQPDRPAQQGWLAPDSSAGSWRFSSSTSCATSSTWRTTRSPYYGVSTRCTTPIPIWTRRRVRDSTPSRWCVTQGAYLAAIAICAPPVGAVVLVELFFTLQSFLSHANASLPRPLESLLRPLWITPDLHRIHHSDQAVDQRPQLRRSLPLVGPPVPDLPGRVGERNREPPTRTRRVSE